MKKVSIIITCYNKEKYVKETIESALNQTYKNLEIVCIDDASTDNSRNILKELKLKYNNIILLEENKNIGVVRARNKAIEIANGEYILPLDADDIIEPTYVSKAVDILDKNPQIGIVYCKAKFFGIKNENWNLPIFDKNKILFGNIIFCTALYRKNDFYKLGKYKEYMENGYEDWDLWLSFVENNFEVHQIPEVLFYYRQLATPSRNSLCNNKNINNIYKNIIINHSELYFNNKEFLERVFGNKIDYLEIEAAKKYKYKKLSNFLIFVIVIETILILVYIILKILGGVF